MAKKFDPDPEFTAAIAERNKAFENDDIEWAARIFPDASCREVIVMAFHKARYECKAVSAKKRHESQQWLVENYVKRLGGEFVIPGERLPR